MFIHMSSICSALGVNGDVSPFTNLDDANILALTCTVALA